MIRQNLRLFTWNSDSSLSNTDVWGYETLEHILYDIPILLFIRFVFGEYSLTTTRERHLSSTLSTTVNLQAGSQAKRGCLMDPIRHTCCRDNIPYKCKAIQVRFFHFSLYFAACLSCILINFKRTSYNWIISTIDGL